MLEVSTRKMRCLAGLSLAAEADDAAREVCDGIEKGALDLAVVFIAREHAEHALTILDIIRTRLDVRNVIGCAAEGVVGSTMEIESGPAVALWTASLPGVRTLPILLDQEDLQSLDEAAEWHDRLGVTPQDLPAFLLVADPYSVDINRCLTGMNAAFPDSVVVGGMASGGRGPGENRLFLNDQVLRRGLVGISFSGPISISTVVSQGCRPVGKTHIITKAHRNVIEELGGRTAVEVLREVRTQSTAEERALMEHGLHVGRVVDEHLRSFGVGDFLIRNVTAIVGGSGLAVSDWVRPGQTIQFHVRDAITGTEELRTLLQRQRKTMPVPPVGGLLFCCNGRGTRLFGRPHHDIGLVNDILGECPVAGFFAQGEIGPVGKRTFIHGFTSCLMLFHED